MSYLLRRDADESERHARAALEIATSEQDVALMARAHEALGEVMRRSDRFGAAVEEFDTAGHHYESLDDEDASERLENKTLRLLGNLGRNAEKIDRLRARIAAHQSSDNPRAEVRVRREIALLHAWSNEHDLAAREIEAALQLAEDKLGVNSRTSILVARAKTRLAAGDAVAARSDWERALELRRQEGKPREIAQTLQGLGDFLTRVGDTEEALATYGDVMHEARRVTDATEQAKLMIRVGKALHRAGSPRGVALLREAVDVAEDGDDPKRLLEARTMLAHALASDGRRTDALEQLRRALRSAQTESWSRDVASIRKHIGRVLYDLGRAREAADCLLEARTQSSQDLELGFQIARACRGTFRYRRSIEELHAYLEAAIARRQTHKEAKARNSLATVLLDVHQPRAAMEHAEKSRAINERAPVRPGTIGAIGISWMACGRAHHQLGERDAAMRAFAASEQRAKESGSDISRTYVLRYRALALACEGDLSGALEQLREALAICETLQEERRTIAKLMDVRARLMLELDCAEALRDADASLAMAQRQRIFETMANARYTRGAALARLGREADAIEALAVARRLCEEIGHAELETVVLEELRPLVAGRAEALQEILERLPVLATQVKAEFPEGTWTTELLARVHALRS